MSSGGSGSRCGNIQHGTKQANEKGRRLAAAAPTYASGHAELAMQGQLCRTSYSDSLTNLFPGAFARQGLLHPALLSRFEIEGVAFHVFNDVLRLNFSLEPTKGAVD